MVPIVNVRDDLGPPSADKLPAPWGNYQLLSVIGSGGNGVVYHAKSLDRGTEVALKTLQFAVLSSSEAMERFDREAKAGAELGHPGIVSVVDCGKVGKMPFLAMPFVKGSNLKQALAAGRFPAREERLRLVLEAARAIAHAHSHRIVHRDVKPPNILIDEEGHARVTDFGLAKRLDQSQPLTAPGQMIGTVLYMPPEQIEGEIEHIGPATDVYALGVVLYEVLTGHPPFTGTTFAAIVGQVLAKEAPLLRSIDPTIPADLEAICRKALAKEPGKRQPTAKEFADELERFLKGEPAPAAEAAGATGVASAHGGASGTATPDSRPWWKRLFGGTLA